MKKVSLLIITFFISFSLYSQNIIGNFENEMNQVLSGSSKNSWDLTIRIPNSKVSSRLTVGLPGETTSIDAVEICKNVNELINKYFFDVKIDRYIGRILHYLEVIEPIPLNNMEFSGKDYFSLESFLLDSGSISDDESDKFKTVQRTSYRTEGPDNAVVGIERKIYVDALYCDYNKFQEIKSLIESEIELEWLD